MMCREMLSAKESAAFFQQLLQGLLVNLQPLPDTQQQQLQSSPLQSACEGLLPAICQLLSPEQYVQQVLQSASGSTNPAAVVDCRALEV